MHAEKRAWNRAKRLCGVVVAVCVLGGAVWFWDDVVKDRVIPKRWSVVAGHDIYRSGQLSGTLIRKMLTNYGIKVIVALTGRDLQDKDQEAEETAAAELGIELRRFPLRGDGTGDINNYAAALAAVVEAERQGKPVLIHCAAGAQRTGGAIAFYQLLVDRKSPPEVIREMKRCGWNPKRNPDLLPYINENLPQLATILHEKGILDKVPDPLPVLPTQ